MDEPTTSTANWWPSLLKVVLEMTLPICSLLTHTIKLHFHGTRIFRFNYYGRCCRTMPVTVITHAFFENPNYNAVKILMGFVNYFLIVSGPGLFNWIFHFVGVEWACTSPFILIKHFIRFSNQFLNKIELWRDSNPRQSIRYQIV